MVALNELCFGGGFDGHPLLSTFSAVFEDISDSGVDRCGSWTRGNPYSARTTW